MKYSPIKLIEPEKLIPYEKNSKTHPQEQIKKIAELMKKWGFPESKAILVDENLEILHGHGRRESAIFANLKKVPYQIVEGLSEEDKKAWRIADNAVAESEWDYELLQQEYELLKELDYDVAIIGLGEEHLTQITETNFWDDDQEEEEADDEVYVDDDPDTSNSMKNVAICVGEIRYTVPVDVYDQWIENVKLEHGFSKEELQKFVQDKLELR